MTNKQSISYVYFSIVFPDWAVEETVGAERAQGAAEEEAPAAAAAVNVIKFVIALGTKITVNLNRHDPAGNQ